MAAIASNQLCSVRARPSKMFTPSKGSVSRSRVTVMAAAKKVAHQAMALLAAAQLVAVPLSAAPALAVDTPDVESAKKALPSLPNPFFGRSKEENKGPTDFSGDIQDSIKKSQSGKFNEADQLADKLNTGAPASGAPSTAGVGKSLSTTDGNL